MEPKVIEEIAEQLGMAVGEASKFIEGILPQYAGMKVVDCAIPLVFAVPLFVLFLALTTHLCKTFVKDDDGDALLFSLFTGAIAFVLMLVTCFFASEVIGWALFPDAKLLDMAIWAVS